jgi:phospholipase C
MTARRAIAAAVVAVFAAVPATASADAKAPAARTPIKHFISLMQENHSFDNYFGTYPGADGVPQDACQPIDVRRPSKGCVKPMRIGGQAVEDLNHSGAAFDAQFNRGRMDGFVSGIAKATGEVQPLVMGHYDDRDLPYYWNVADNYVLFDRFFTSARAGSVTNHMYWVTGGPGDPHADTIPPGGFDKQTTIFDRLEQKGVSWKFYVQNYDPRITFRAKHLGDRGSQVVWVPLLNYARYVDDPKLFRHIVPIEQFYEDVRRGTLPAVSYIVPSGSSEHPPGSIKAGETFVRTMLNALARSRLWSSSAFTWTYDDWGGWYDHVRPPQVDGHGYGFRAPALLVSAWAKKGYVDHTTMDFTSILRFVEENWGLAPLASRDRRANSLASAFDFKSGPRRPMYLTRDRHVAARKEPHRTPVYVGYTLAALLTLAVIAAAAVRDTRRRARPALNGGSTSLLVEPLDGVGAGYEEVHR